MKSIALSIVLAVCTIATAQAEDILCPPEKPSFPVKLDTWEHQYNGFLTKVWFSLSYSNDGKPSLAMITCYRNSGSAQIIFKERACRIIAGEGSVEVFEQTKRNENIQCTLADKKHKMISVEKTNDKQCLVTCN